MNDDDVILFELRKNRDMYKKSRDAHFFSEIERMMRDFQTDFEAIAVSIGPGMFTSLRVGLSLAKGFALSHGTPIVAVNTLDAMGIPLAFTKCHVLATINAYHNEIYAALYKSGQRISDYRLITPDMVNDVIEDTTIVIGSGVAVLRTSRVFKKNRSVVLVDDKSVYPTASKIVMCALPRILAGSFDDAEDMEPFYIKKTDAERNYDKTHQAR